MSMPICSCSSLSRVAPKPPLIEKQSLSDNGNREADTPNFSISLISKYALAFPE
jgi:hypothetical protein